MWPVERSGQVLAGQQRSDKYEQYGRADQEPFDARQSAGRGRIQRKFSKLATAPGTDIIHNNIGVRLVAPRQMAPDNGANTVQLSRVNVLVRGGGCFEFPYVFENHSISTKRKLRDCASKYRQPVVAVGRV